MLRLTSLLCSLSLLAGCYLEVVAPRGGHVTSSSGSLDCAESTTCATEVLDTSFSETFTAEPKEGFTFIRWQSGGAFLCADSTNPTCAVTNTLFQGNPVIESFIANSFQTFYLMPVFEFVGIDTDNDGTFDHLDDNDDDDSFLDADDPCPLTPDPACGTGSPISDTIVADDREWAQVDLFLNLSWDDLNAACPSGPCADGSVLNGQDMTGWRWATVAEVNSLFNYYIGFPYPLGSLPDGFSETDAPWTGSFYSDGWRATLTGGGQVALLGWLSDAGSVALAFTALMQEIETEGAPDSASTLTQSNKTIASTVTGAWFYRGVD